MIHINELFNGRSYVSQQEQWMNKIAEHCTHALTLQTSIRSGFITRGREQVRRDEVTRCLHDFIQRFNREATGNGWKRKDNYKPIFLPVIEGLLPSGNVNLTVHVHAILGNLPGYVSEDVLKPMVDELWANTSVGVADTCVERLEAGTESRWTGYMTKESHRGNWECVSFETAQIPKFVQEKIKS